MSVPTPARIPFEDVPRGPHQARADETDDSRVRTSWAPVVLTDALAGIETPPPTILHRTDGFPLLYAGRTHSFHGPSESLKSWAADFATAEMLHSGIDVGFIDFEDDALGRVSRLVGLGVERELIAKHLVYVRPDEPLGACGDDFTELLDRRFGLVVIDGVTEAMVTEGLNMIDNMDVAKWLRRLPRRFAATGAAVIMIDHVTKDEGGRGRHAIGGQHKLAGLSGAAYSFKPERRLARATSEPIEGRVKIDVVKDRPGHIRSHADGDHVATMVVTSYPDGGVTIDFEPPGSSDTTPDVKLQVRVLEYLATYDGSSKNGITGGVVGNADAIRQAAAWLATAGLVRVEIKLPAHLHWITDEGRRFLEEHGATATSQPPTSK